ncbi:MAG: PIN domain-containing protein [Acidobacteria bacterium]|nr:PIN domain-containing protein [Acidobacteriota bacterium]
MSRLLCAFRELPVDGDVAERAGRIRRESGLRLPDALVAATALVHGLSLVTGAVVTSNPSPGRLHDSSSDGARRQRARVDAGTLQEIAALIRTKV